MTLFTRNSIKSGIECTLKTCGMSGAFPASRPRRPRSSSRRSVCCSTSSAVFTLCIIYSALTLRARGIVIEHVVSIISSVLHNISTHSDKKPTDLGTSSSLIAARAGISGAGSGGRKLANLPIFLMGMKRSTRHGESRFILIFMSLLWLTLESHTAPTSRVRLRKRLGADNFRSSILIAIYYQLFVYKMHQRRQGALRSLGPGRERHSAERQECVGQLRNCHSFAEVTVTEARSGPTEFLLRTQRQRLGGR